MCTVGAAIMTGLNVIGSYYGQKATADAAQDQMDAKRQSAVTNMNYMFQNYEMERQNAFDATVTKLDELSHNSMGLNSKVRAAANEGMQGRTADLLVRNTEADAHRTAASLKTNYAKNSNEIDLNKEAALLSTNDYIKGINASAPKMPSTFSNFLSTAGIILDGYTKGQDERQNRKSAGRMNASGY